MKRLCWYVNWIGQWAVATFGVTSELVVAGLFRKIKDEIEEYKQNREVSELADIFIVFVQAVYRIVHSSGHSVSVDVMIDPYIDFIPVNESIASKLPGILTVEEGLDSIALLCDRFIKTKEWAFVQMIYAEFLSVLRHAQPINFEEAISSKMLINFSRQWQQPDSQGRVQHVSKPKRSND
jgi:hypothetical protein